MTYDNQYDNSAPAPSPAPKDEPKYENDYVSRTEIEPPGPSTVTFPFPQEMPIR